MQHRTFFLNQYYPSHFSYCIQINTTIIPKDWLCETCQPKHDSTSPHKVNQEFSAWASKRKPSVKRAKVKYLDLDEVIRLSSAKASGGSKNVISKIPSLTAKSNPPILPPKVLGKLPRNNEVLKKTMTNQHDSCSLFKGGNFSPSLLPCLFFLAFMVHVHESTKF